MKIGYARVSSDDQNLDTQRDALNQAGCKRLYEEIESGGKVDRPELLRLLEALRKGDRLVVWRLDRLGRSLKHLIETVDRRKQQNELQITECSSCNADSVAGACQGRHG